MVDTTREPKETAATATPSEDTGPVGNRRDRTTKTSQDRLTFPPLVCRFHISSSSKLGGGGIILLLPATANKEIQEWEQ